MEHGDHAGPRANAKIMNNTMSFGTECLLGMVQADHSSTETCRTQGQTVGVGLSFHRFRKEVLARLNIIDVAGLEWRRGLLRSTMIAVRGSGEAALQVRGCSGLPCGIPLSGLLFSGERTLARCRSENVLRGLCYFCLLYSWAEIACMAA